MSFKRCYGSDITTMQMQERSLDIWKVNISVVRALKIVLTVSRIVYFVGNLTDDHRPLSCNASRSLQNGKY